MLLLILALLLGWLFGHVLLAICLLLASYLFFQMRALYRLENWLRNSRSSTIPYNNGIWGEIYYLYSRSKQRQRKSKKRLVNYLNRFQKMTNAMPDATVVLGEDDVIEWFNGAARQVLGLRHPEDIGQRIDNLIRIPQFIEHLHTARHGEELEISAPDNAARILSIAVVPYGKSSRLLIARDVSQLHCLEAARRDFVANVSHELRTPLTVIHGYLETLADLPESDPLYRRWGQPLSVMYEQSQRMTSIVEDLLMLSRLETSRREIYRDAVDMPLMIRAVLDEARPLSGEQGHNFHLQLESDLKLFGHQAQLFSLISNLVFNAVRYTPKGGDITLRWFCEGEFACFEVKDSGVGIAPQHIPRLTERFYRVDEGRSRDSGGTGLGLAIVKHILENHDGRLTIESTVGKGSLFRCCFPERYIADPDVTKVS